MNILCHRLDRHEAVRRLTAIKPRVLLLLILWAAASWPPLLSGQEERDFLAEARVAFGKQQFDRARQLLEPLAAGKGATAEVHALLGLARIQLSKPDLQKGVASLRRAIAIDPEQPEAHLGFGLLYNRQKQSMRALSHLKRVVLKRPKWSEGHLQAGIALYDLGRLEDAKGEFKRATSLPAAVEYLALIESAQNHHEIAAELIRRLLAHTPEDAAQRGRLLYQRAVFLRKASKNEEAQASLEAAVKAGYDRLEAHQLIGDIAYDAEKLDLALRSYRLALKKPSIHHEVRDIPASADLYYDLGLILYRQEKFGEARAALEKSVAENAFHPNSWYKLGQTLQRLKERKEARAALRRHREVERINEQLKSARRSLEVVPNNMKNRLALAGMLEHMKRWRGAFDQLRIVEQTAPQTQGLYLRLKTAAEALGRADLVHWYEQKIQKQASVPPEKKSKGSPDGGDGQ